MSIGIATRSDENERNSFYVNTELFRLWHVIRGRSHASSTKRWKGHNVIVLLLNQLYCLEVGRGFHFLKQKTANLLLYKKI